MPAVILTPLLDQPLPDLVLASTAGETFALRAHVGAGPQVYFFFIRAGTPTWVRELREFRAAHSEFAALDTRVAGVSFDPLQRARAWSERLKLPYPLLADTERHLAGALGLIRRIGIGGWSVEMLRRATILADRAGVIRGVWENVKVRGHAREVLAAARALRLS